MSVLGKCLGLLLWAGLVAGGGVVIWLQALPSQVVPNDGVTYTGAVMVFVGVALSLAWFGVLRGASRK